MAQTSGQGNRQGHCEFNICDLETAFKVLLNCLEPPIDLHKRYLPNAIKSLKYKFHNYITRYALLYRRSSPSANDNPCNDSLAASHNAEPTNFYNRLDEIAKPSQYFIKMVLKTLTVNAIPLDRGNKKLTRLIEICAAEGDKQTPSESLGNDNQEKGKVRNPRKIGTPRVRTAKWMRDYSQSIAEVPIV